MHTETLLLDIETSQQLTRALLENSLDLDPIAATDECVDGHHARIQAYPLACPALEDIVKTAALI